MHREDLLPKTASSYERSRKTQMWRGMIRRSEDGEGMRQGRGKNIEDCIERNMVKEVYA